MRWCAWSWPARVTVPDPVRPGGLLRVDKSKAKGGENLDGTYLLHCAAKSTALASYGLLVAWLALSPRCALQSRCSGSAMKGGATHDHIENACSVRARPGGAMIR
jgi:hypothetical protein